MLLENPTDDVLEFQFDGSNYVFHPGEQRNLSEKTGGHLLRHLGIRGLVELKHGDDEAEVRANARERADEFWKQQIATFRRMNQAREATGLLPLQPSESMLDTIERVEGRESRNRYEYQTRETANMMLEQLVKSQTSQGGDVASAVQAMTQAMTAMMETQAQTNSLLARLAGEDGDEEKGGKGKK